MLRRDIKQEKRVERNRSGKFKIFRKMVREVLTAQVTLEQRFGVEGMSRQLSGWREQLVQRPLRWDVPDVFEDWQGG